MDNEKEKDVFIRITNKDIYSEIKNLHKTVEEVLSQAKYTNGRVTKLEKKSIGIWVEKNPIKFTLIIVSILALFFEDFISPLIETIKIII